MADAGSISELLGVLGPATHGVEAVVERSGDHWAVLLAGGGELAW